MHINVRDILAESVGYNRSYKITGERPDLEGIRLTRDIEGEIQISRLDASLLVSGQLDTEIQLECHRCLRTFTRPMHVGLSQEYAREPVDDQLPVSPDDDIDLAPLAAQEIILNTPMQILCRPDCPGIEGVAGKYNKTDDNDASVKNRAHITKGTKRGRT